MPVGRTDQLSAILKAQQRPAVSRTALAPEAPELAFAKAVTYDTNLVSPFSIAVGDLNGDGNLDLVVGGAATAAGYGDADLSVLLGNGDGTFQAPVNYLSGGYGYISVAIADVNGDRHPDIVFSVACQSASDCNNGTVNVMLGKGDGTFKKPVSYHSGGVDTDFVAVGDVNGDGWPDLVVTNACQNVGCTGNGSVSVLFGKGGGTFKAPVTYDSGGVRAISCVIGNLKAGGFPDLAVANFTSGTVGVLLNNGNGTFGLAVPTTRLRILTHWRLQTSTEMGTRTWSSARKTAARWTSCWAMAMELSNLMSLTPLQEALHGRLRSPT